MKILPARFFVRACWLLALLIFTGVACCHAQVTIYAKFADGVGSWDGGVTRPELSPSQRTGWVQLDSFSVNCDNSSTIQSGSGVGVGAVDFKPAAFTKIVDRLTPTIFSNLASGQFVRSDSVSSAAPVTVEFVKQVAGVPLVVLRLELKLAIFTSQSPKAGTGDDEVREDIQMLFGSVRLTAWPVNANGTLGTPVIQAWNRVNNTNVFP